jgi:hypothetical protein
VIPALVVVAGAVGAALAALLVEVLTLAASLVSIRPLVGWPFGRATVKGLAAAATGAVVAALVPAGAARLGAALLAYLVVLAGLRPVPGAVYLRLLRGALGRPGPPSAAGVG